MLRPNDIKNVIVFLLVLFAAPVWCFADIKLDKDGNYVEFTYATMSDGVKIAVAVGYPKGFDPQDQIQKWPAILEMSGYPQASRPVYRGDRYGERYITVSASLRGTGASGGAFAAFSERNIKDGYEIIENWIVKQPWSNGKVGIHGHSWSGITGFLIATSNPPHLGAVVVSGVIDDGYRGTVRIGGILNTGFTFNWMNRFYLPTGVWGSDQAAARIRGLSESEALQIKQSRPPRNIAQENLWQLLQLTEDKPPWPKSPRHYAAGIRAPIFILHAYQDQQVGGRGVWLFDHVPDNIPKRLLISNGHHNTPTTFRPQRRAWFDFWLRGERRAALLNIDDPDTRVQVVFEVQRGQKKNEPLLSSDFPLPETIWKRYYLTSNGLLSTTPSMRQGDSGAEGDTYEVGVGIADDKLDGVDYQLAFDEPTAICGPITLTLWASSTTVDTDLFAIVSDVDPDGRVQHLQRGMLRASHRALDEELSQWVDAQGEKVLIRPHHPHVDPQPLYPRKPYRLDIEIFPVGHVFREGHKLLLSISQPPLNDPVPIPRGQMRTFQYESNQPPGTVTIHRGAGYPSSILLPVLPSLPPISDNPPAAGDLMGIYVQPNNSDE